MELKVALEAVVVVTNVRLASKLALLVAIYVVSLPVLSAVLPDDRIDLLYHGYDGDEVEIDGPSILVRKSIADKVSISANYYVDTVTGASIDVRTSGASEYTEERTEYSVGVDYLVDKSVMSLSYTNSTENDYVADAVSFGVSQDFFGDLTTISVGVSFGENEIGRNDDDEFLEESESRRYRFALSQILTKNWIANLSIETISDSGYLNNPYRFTRFLNETGGFSLEPELYPETRNSDAFALRTMYYLPYRASVRLEARHYNDSWDIEANNYEIRYTHPFDNGLMIEAKVRQYEQTGASFYQDIYTFRRDSGSNPNEPRARDKELSDFSSLNYGLGITYEFKGPFLNFFDKGSINLYWDHFQVDYDNFRDATAEGFDPGAEPLFSLDANVIRFFASFWY